MASILDRYGIREVADVTFYTIDSEGNADVPVLYLDTLKISNIEQTAENVSARGGKGNAELIMWDYGKEITVNIEDALFSPKSLAMMYGVEADTSKNDGFKTAETVIKTVPFDKATMSEGAPQDYTINGQSFKVKEAAFYDENGSVLTYQAGETSTPGKWTKDGGSEEVPDPVYAKLTLKVTGHQIVISADNFPDTYYVTGDTYARSEETGEDEMFQFIIPKAKMQSEVTLTMEAEGDPSTFSMNLKVLRPKNGEMMKLVQYGVSADTE